MSFDAATANIKLSREVLDGSRTYVDKAVKSYYYIDERGTALRTTDDLSTPPGEQFPFPLIERSLPLKNEAKKRSQDPRLGRGRPASATNG